MHKAAAIASVDTVVPAFQIVFSGQIPRNRIIGSEETGILDALEFHCQTAALISSFPCSVSGPLGALSRMTDPKCAF